LDARNLCLHGSMISKWQVHVSYVLQYKFHAIDVLLLLWYEECMILEIYCMYMKYIHAIPTMLKMLKNYMKHNIPYLWQCELWTPILLLSQSCCVCFLPSSPRGIRTQKYSCVPRAMSCYHHILSQAMICRIQSVIWLKKIQ